MIVGNKKDLEENRVIEMTEAAIFAQENGKYRYFFYVKTCYLIDCLFVETSAMTGENIE